MEVTQSKIIVVGRLEEIQLIEDMVEEDGRYIITHTITTDEDIYIIPLENYIDNLFIEQKKYKYNG